MGLQGTKQNINIGQMFHKASNSDKKIGDYPPLLKQKYKESYCVI
jgi:hypothetical protein